MNGPAEDPDLGRAGGAWFPADSPCAVNPASFDCGDCEIGLLDQCRLRTDSDGRYLHAARFRRLGGWLGLSLHEAEAIAVATRSIYQRTGLDVPLGALRFPASHVEAVWASDFGVATTPSGMARPIGNEEVVAPQPNRVVEYGGVLYMRTLLGGAVRHRVRNRARFLELRAIERLLDSASVHDSPTAADVERLCSVEAMAYSDIERVAFGSRGLAFTADPERIELRRRVLLSVRAEPFNAADLSPLRARASEISSELVVVNAPLALDHVYRSRTGHWRYAYSPGASHLDLVQHALLGLIRAVQLFDPMRGSAFSTYAMQWVKQAADRGYKESRFTARMPVHLHERLQSTIERWNTVRSRCPEDHSAIPVEALLWLDSELSSGEAELAARALNVCDPVSLEALAASPGPGKLDPLSNRPHRWAAGSDRMFEEVERDDQRRSLVFDVQEVLKGLPPRIADVLSRRFGGFGSVDGQGRQTLQEIGDALGLTRERVRQLEAKGLRYLRESPHAAGFRARWQSGTRKIRGPSVRRRSPLKRKPD